MPSMLVRRSVGDVTPSPTPIASPLIGVTVQDAMRPGVVTCLPDASLSTVAAIMAIHGIHSVVLSQPERDTPLVVTDLELVRAALEGADDTRAADIAREPAATLSIYASLDDAVAMMAIGYIAHLLATDPSSGAPVGIVSCFDVASVVGGWEPRLARIRRPDPATSPVARTLRGARIRDVMHRGLATCPPDTPLTVVARSMAEHRIHCVAVAGVDNISGREEHLLTWGLIDDLDLVVALHRGALDAPAATIAEPALVALQEDASLDRAAALMLEHDTRHVMAVGQSGLPSGMVSTLDVAWILAWSR
jgi:CBS domain-containing protein